MVRNFIKIAEALNPEHAGRIFKWHYRSSYFGVTKIYYWNLIEHGKGMDDDVAAARIMERNGGQWRVYVFDYDKPVHGGAIFTADSLEGAKRGAEECLDLPPCVDAPIVEALNVPAIKPPMPDIGYLVRHMGTQYVVEGWYKIVPDDFSYIEYPYYVSTRYWPDMQNSHRIIPCERHEGDCIAVTNMGERGFVLGPHDYQITGEPFTDDGDAIERMRNEHYAFVTKAKEAEERYANRVDETLKPSLSYRHPFFTPYEGTDTPLEYTSIDNIPLYQQKLYFDSWGWPYDDDGSHFHITDEQDDAMYKDWYHAQLAYLGKPITEALNPRHAGPILIWMPFWEADNEIGGWYLRKKNSDGKWGLAPMVTVRYQYDWPDKPPVAVIVFRSDFASSSIECVNDLEEGRRRAEQMLKLNRVRELQTVGFRRQNQ